MKTKKASAVAMAGLLASTVTVLGGVATAPSASAHGCGQWEVKSITSKSGQRVLIPSSRSAGPFQFGGQQSLSRADGKLDARTNGSSDSVSGSVGVSFPVVEASAEYNRTWNRSTTKTTTYTQTFTTTSPTMSRKVRWRWRLYQDGWMFTSTKVRERGHSPCRDWKVEKRTMRFIVPVRQKIYTFAVERFANRGKVLDARGRPIG